MEVPGATSPRARDRPAARQLEVELRPHAAWLRVHVTGANSLAHTMEYWTRILRAVTAHPRPVLLVDELEGPSLTAEEWRLLVATLAGSALQGVRIAHVRPNGLDALEFCELHAVDAGFDARVFVDEAEAARWLRYGEGAPA